MVTHIYANRTFVLHYTQDDTTLNESPHVRHTAQRLSQLQRQHQVDFCNALRNRRQETRTRRTVDDLVVNCQRKI